MTRRSRFIAVPLIAVGLAMALALPAHAQSGGATPPQSGSAAESESQQFSPSQLESFAKATLKIEDIGREWQPRIAQSKDVSEAKKMQDEAVQQMMAAVTAEDLSLEEYDQIALAYEKRPDVRGEIDKLREDLQ